MMILAFFIVFILGVITGGISMIFILRKPLQKAAKELDEIMDLVYKDKEDKDDAKIPE